MNLKTIFANIVAFFNTPKVEHAIASIEGSIKSLEAVALHHAGQVEAKAAKQAKLAIENVEHEAQRLRAALISRNLTALIYPQPVAQSASAPVASGNVVLSAPSANGTSPQ